MRKEKIRGEDENKLEMTTWMVSEEMGENERGKKQLIKTGDKIRNMSSGCW